jgi:hypothetical protein
VHLLLTSRNACAYNGRPNARCECALSSLVHVYACRVARACEVSSYACGLFAQSASARNTPVAANESGCACVRMRLQFACAFVRMHSHVSMLQPSSSGVMHAKPRGVHGTGQARHDGTSTPPHKKCEHGNARYGLCVQVLHLAGLTSTLCSVDTSALVVDCGIFRKLPCLQTRYIVESASDASLGAEIDPAQPLASVSSLGQKAGLLIHGFQFVNHL